MIILDVFQNYVFTVIIHYIFHCRLKKSNDSINLADACEYAVTKLLLEHITPSYVFTTKTAIP
jgi:hypothetical protein